MMPSLATRMRTGCLVAGALLGVIGTARAQELPCNTHGVVKVQPPNPVAGAEFGDAVALDAATLVVGAPQTPGARPDVSGAAYVYGSSEGLPSRGGHRSLQWNPQATLSAPDSLSGVQFGDAVAIAGNLLVVGASDTTGTAQGAACVYRYDGTTWPLEATLTASGAVTGEHFGAAVALGSDVVVVGAPYAGAEAGAVYVFRLSSGAWAQEARLTASDGGAGDHFGSSVAVSGDAILVGAPDDDDAGQDSGSAYVFRHAGGGWNQEQKISASSGAAGDRFGLAVALVADAALIGAPAQADAGMARVACVYRHSGAGWSEEAQLSLESSGRFRQVSVALSDGLALVGANGDGASPETDGQAWVWHFNGTTWEPYAWLYGTVGEGLPEASLGSSVALSGEIAVVGARRAEVNCGSGNCSAGAVYTYRGLADCNGNGVLDVCDIYHEVSADCNDNELPDECDIALGTSYDCNGNGVPDECEVHDTITGADYDCNGNGKFDSCDIADGTSADCNNNAVPDECDLAAGTSQDCNGNGIPDECDIAAGTSQDTKLPGTPDECVSDACPLACQLKETSLAVDPETTEFIGDFGAPLAISGPVLAVAAPTYGHWQGGAVYLYRRVDGTWAWEDTLSNSGEMGFGTGLAVDGDTLVASKSGGIAVGDCWTEVDRYVDGAWVHEAIIDHLGLAVAIDGDVIVLVGETPDICRPHTCWDPNDPNYDPVECGVPQHPRVYRRQAGTWQLEARLEVPGATGYDRAVALSGNMAAVSTAGLWHLFEYDGSTWTDIQTLPAGSLSIDGDTLALGGPRQAQVYEFDGSTWTLTATLTPACADGGFGKMVSISGDTLLVASNYAVHAFVRQAGAWPEVARLTPGDGTNAIRALAMSEGTAAVSLTDGSKNVYLFTGLADQNANGDVDACEDTGPPHCGAGACGANVLGWLPLTLLGLGVLKVRAARRG